MIVFFIGIALLATLLLKYQGFPELADVKISSILLAAGFALLAALLWRMQRDRTTTYDALDMLMDNGRASLESHITIVMAVVAIWWIVTQTLAGKDVSERMIDILMIFVIYRGAKKAIDAYSNRPTVMPPNQDIQQQVVVTPDAPDVPAQRPMPTVRAAKAAAVSPTKTATGKPITPK